MESTSLLHSPTTPPAQRSLTARLLQYLAFFMVGTISWITTTALFAQASAFQLVVPEGAKIFTYIDTAMESGNLVPAIIFVACSSEATLRAYNTRMTYAVAIGSCFTAVLLGTLWDTQIGGASVVILAGAWSSGAVGSTSMLVLFNFAGRYGRDAVSALSVGIGSCGLVTNILGIVQGLPKLKDSGGSSSHHSNQSSVTPLTPSSSGATLDGKLLFGPSVFFIAVGVWIIFGCCFLRMLDTFSQWKIATATAPTDHADSSTAETGIQSSLTSAGGNSVNSEMSASSLPVAYVETTKRFSLLEKLNEAMNSIVSAVHQNSGSMAAIFVSCFLEFAAPGLIPYQVPKGVNHAANSFWVTVFYLSGSLLGRLLTAVVSFQKFTLLNILQGLTLVYMLVVARMEDVTIPVPISIAVVAVGSAIHGYIVTEVFQTCREVGNSARTSAVAGLANQLGALSGSLFVFMLVKLSIIGGK